MFIRDFIINTPKSKEKQTLLNNTKISSIFMLINRFNINNKNNVVSSITTIYIFFKNFKNSNSIKFVECLTLFLMFINKSNNVNHFFVNIGGIRCNTSYKNINIENKNILQKYVEGGVLIAKNINNFFLNTIKGGSIKLSFKVGSKIKLQNSSIIKKLSPNNIEKLETMFLRKNRVYNKGRYSRCRQNYRTGVYLCMYLSVISIFGLYY